MPQHQIWILPNSGCSKDHPARFPLLHFLDDRILLLEKFIIDKLSVPWRHFCSAVAANKCIYPHFLFAVERVRYLGKTSYKVVLKIFLTQLLSASRAAAEYSRIVCICSLLIRAVIKGGQLCTTRR